MGGKYSYRPLKCRDVKRALTNLGFTKRPPTAGTSHESWTATIDGKFRKVTVDCHKGEVKAKDVKSIIGQADVGKRKFFDSI